MRRKRQRPQLLSDFTVPAAAKFMISWFHDSRAAVFFDVFAKCEVRAICEANFTLNFTVQGPEGRVGPWRRARGSTWRLRRFPVSVQRVGHGAQTTLQRPIECLTATLVCTVYNRRERPFRPFFRDKKRGGRRRPIFGQAACFPWVSSRVVPPQPVLSRHSGFMCPLTGGRSLATADGRGNAKYAQAARQP